MTDVEPTLIVAFGDTHHGGTVSLMAPDPIPLDDGGSYVPDSKISAQLWRWWLRFWESAEIERERIAKRYGSCKLGLLCNGDVFEGDHHQTLQIVERHRGVEMHIAKRAWQEPLALGPDRIWITRGTAPHSGEGAGAEEGFAKYLRDQGHPVQHDPAIPANSTAYHWYIDVGPWRIWATHHGSMGRTPRTKASLIALRTSDAWIQLELDNWRYRLQGEEPEKVPCLLLRSHFHQWAESAPSMFPMHGVQLPCWTYSNAHAMRVAPTTLPDIGGALVRCLPDRPRPEVDPIIYRPRRAEACRI